MNIINWNIGNKFQWNFNQNSNFSHEFSFKKMHLKMLSAKWRLLHLGVNALMRHEHWFRRWLGAIQQQAITWVNVDPDLCHHMASLGHSELKQTMIKFDCNFRSEKCIWRNAMSGDHFLQTPSQWQMMLQYNVSHWLGPYTKWSLCKMAWLEISSVRI